MSVLISQRAILKKINIINIAFKKDLEQMSYFAPLAMQHLFFQPVEQVQLGQYAVYFVMFKSTENHSVTCVRCP